MKVKREIGNVLEIIENNVKNIEIVKIKKKIYFLLRSSHAASFVYHSFTAPSLT